MSKVTENSGAILKLAKEKTVQVIDQFCAEMAMASAQEAPVDTGNLRDTITHEVNGLEGRVYTQTGKANGGEGYGFWVHEGYTSRGGKQVPARPFFRQGFHRTKEAYRNG